MYAGVDEGISWRPLGGAKPGTEGPPGKESPSTSVRESLSPHSSGAEADVDSQGMPGGYTDSGDRLALAVGDQQQGSFQSPRAGFFHGGAFSPAERHRKKLLAQRQPEAEDAQLELRIANRDSGSRKKSVKNPFGLTLWCSSGNEGGQEGGEGGSGSGQEERDPSPQSPLADRVPIGDETAREREWPEQRIGTQKPAETWRRGMALEAERSTPSPPVSLGLALQSGSRRKRESETDTLHNSVTQPSCSIGLAHLELNTSREASESGDRKVKRHQRWPDESPEEAGVRLRRVADPRLTVGIPSGEEERQKAGFREQVKRPRVEPLSGSLSPPPPRVAKPPQRNRGFDYPAALRSSVEAFLAQSSSGVSDGGLNPSPPLWPPPERAAKLPPPFVQQELMEKQPPPRRVVHPVSPAVVPDYPLLPPQVVNRPVPEIPLQGVAPYPHVFGGVAGASNKIHPYPKVPLDPTVYPFGAVRAVPAPPYGALPPEWAAPFLPHMFAAGFDPQKARVLGASNHGFVNPPGKAVHPMWAEAMARWQMPREQNRGVAEQGVPEEGRSQSQSWPHSTPLPGNSLQVGP